MSELSGVDSASPGICEQILASIPQTEPFRFVDRILEVDSDRISGQYHFKVDEPFYRGHFPGNPVTPGVILLESMAQIAIIGHAMFLMMQENQESSKKPSVTPLFTEINADFINTVLPDQTVTVKGEKVYWRRQKLKSKVELYLPDGSLAVQAEMAGIGVL